MAKKKAEYVVLDNAGEGAQFAPTFALAKKKAEMLCAESVTGTRVYLAKIVGVARASATINWDRKMGTGHG